MKTSVNLTIKSKMILSFALVVILFIIFGFISIREMNTLSQLTSTLYEHPLQVSNAALKAKAGVISMHRSMKDVSTARTPMSISLAIKKVQDEEQIVYKDLAIIQQLIIGEEGKHLIEETTTLFTGWKPIRVEVEEFVLQGDRDAANKITREKGADYVARLERKMIELTSYALNKADGFMADAEQTKKMIFRNVLLFITILIIFTLVIGFLMSSSILSSISFLQKTMTKITETGKLEEAVIKGNDEISLMTGYFNGLIQQLKEQFWLGRGDITLNQTLSGNLTEQEILTQGIEFISRYVDACAGAIYTYNNQQETCNLAASYALVEKQLFGKKFKQGQGIIGQVAKEKKAILLQNIHPGDALGESGTLSQTPNAIFAVPLLHEHQFHGVLEIACFDNMDQTKQTFLSSSGTILSTMLHTANQNKQIKTLLETSQETNEKLQAQTEELQAQTEELQALNEEFQQQSDELKDQNTELEIQRQHVEEANRLKSEFLSNMSHELRTPLNSVNALSRVLILQAREKLTSEEINYLEIIERNGKHLLSLINDILDLSKIEAGRMDIHLSSFSIKTMIENIMESIAPLAVEKNIQFEKICPDDLPNIESDESRTYQILQNIITNAVKFTDQGSVVISAKKTENHIDISVKDTGIGISTKDLEDIFEEFRQVDGASTRKFEGTGLGLAIAYKAAKLMGGNIQVNSTIGKGSEFTISLPVEYKGDLKKITAFNKGITLPDEKINHPQKKTILIVDDDPKILETISRALTDEGFDTLTATNGKTAIELAKEHQPFAISLDVVMPGMDGWEVLSILKKDPTTSSIPVIIISVSDDSDTGFALGAVGYITKPIDRESLIKEINNIYGYLPSCVLVVDDDDFERSQTAQIITSEGMKTLLADGGKHCLEILETNQPDVLVLDLVMPEMDGFELLKTIRKNPDTANLPVIVVSAKDLSLEEKEQLNKHVSSILVKSKTSSNQLMEDIKTILTKIGKKGIVLDDKNLKIKNNILVVEDNEAAVIQVKKAVETIGLDVDVARDGQQALDYFQHTIPRGIIMDLMMPDVDGFQVLESIRSTPLTRELPVLILTAKDLTKRDLQRLSSNNIQQLVQKGDVDKEELLNKIKKMLSNPDTPPAQDLPSLSPVLSSSPVRSKSDIANSLPIILIVEDNPDNMTTIKAVIQNGYIIKEATDGELGLNMARSLLPDLILLDMSLPKMDGFSVIGELKSQINTKRIPVIALTAQAMKGDKEKMIAAGCDDYIAKPINPETILDTINLWIKHPSKEKP